MIRSIVALTLSSICVMACAQTPPAQSETAGQAASPAPAQPPSSRAGAAHSVDARAGATSVGARAATGPYVPRGDDSRRHIP